MPRTTARTERRRQSSAVARQRSPRLLARRTFLALILLNVLVYSSVHSFEFVNWDDPTYITENPNVQKGLSWETVRWALTTTHSPYWHPMSWLTHLTDVTLFGMDAGGHHVTNVLIHMANTLLLFGLCLRMTGAPGRSAFVAAVFAVHPLHVESVAWVTERKDVLSTFFWALTIWAYLKYAAERRLTNYLLVAGFFMLALMSKPMVVTLPVVLLLLDIWPLRRVSLEHPDRATWKRAVLEKLPLLGLAIATSIATVIVQHDVGAMAGFDVLPWHVRIANATVAYFSYLWKAIWPVNLAPFYPYRAVPAWVALASILSLLGATAAAVAWRRKPYLLVGWLWYVVTLSPVIGLLQAGEQRMADRFMYVPLIGVLIIAAWSAADLAARWPRVRSAVVGLAFVIVAGCTGAARAQVQHWSDSVSLWQHAARVTPDSYIAFENLGQALRERGRLEEALVHYRTALALAPGGSRKYQAIINNSIGLVLTRLDRAAEARRRFEAAVQLDPEFAEPRSNLANGLAAQGNFAEAVDHYTAAVRIKPDFTEAHLGLGNTRLSLGDGTGAIVPYREALRLDPNLAEAHNGLGAALARIGRGEEAMSEYQEALRLKPNLPTAHFNVAVLLIRKGRIAEAKSHLQQALSSDPDYTQARQLLDRLLTSSF